SDAPAATIIVSSESSDPAATRMFRPGEEPDDDSICVGGRVSVAGYEIQGELGRGGMGVVYRARQLGLNRIVALQMILSGGNAGAYGPRAGSRSERRRAAGRRVFTGFDAL